MHTSDFDYDLPESLIAQHPAQKRDASRLLCLDKHTGAIQHETFANIIEHLQAGDVLVLNNTKVIPARLYGSKKGGTAVAEVLLLKRVERLEDGWEILIRPGKRFKKGSTIVFGDGRLQGTIVEETAAGRVIVFYYDGVFEEHLDALGTMPLPPYIHETLSDASRYQTVYAKVQGSAAAPTAGLHFTEPLLEAIRAKGVFVAPVLLHVGLGTFRPVSETRLEDHLMHSEYFEVSNEAAELINTAKQEGRRIISVGTTSTRVLESAAKDGVLHAGSGWTDIFIYPGYQWQMVDALITNFHLPKSTLLMLVSALAGREHILHAYHIAVEEHYRFFSFGDAMFIS